ncbi:hypothetical protein [Psychrobacter sp. W2-37-MNA-CIBAN-0211]|uniref:hypothetical protein n=1 Tax=Psychrobacter sp. W2-37-MNA-CIBAN-0211 TaxID=3140443 RepID=UPI00332155F1
MTEYNHRMSLCVPQSMIANANQLALIAGENAADVYTFGTADWQDADGNLYTVCSTVIKDKVLALFDQELDGEKLYDHALDADVASAQKALNSSVIYEAGMVASIDKIIIGVDIEPLLFFQAIGLSVVIDTDLEQI